MQITIAVPTFCVLPDVHVCVTHLSFVMVVPLEAYQHANTAETSLQSRNILIDLSEKLNLIQSTPSIGRKCQSVSRLVLDFMK